MTPTRIKVTTTSTTRVGSAVGSATVRTETVVETVAVYNVSDFEDDEDDSNYFSDDVVEQDGAQVPPASSNGATRAIVLPSAANASNASALALHHRPLVKRYRPTAPGALRRFNGHCYVLTCAQETGLYKYR